MSELTGGETNRRWTLQPACVNEHYDWWRVMVIEGPMLEPKRGRPTVQVMPVSEHEEALRAAEEWAHSSEHPNWEAGWNAGRSRAVRVTEEMVSRLVRAFREHGRPVGDGVARLALAAALSASSPKQSRNLITDEIAESNRSGKRPGGGYTFNAFPPDDYEGFVLVVACVRLGDHAHLDVESGRQVIGGNGDAQIHRSRAGRLIFPWHEWLRVRGLLELVPWTRIAEVENPTPGQLEHHSVPAPPKPSKQPEVTAEMVERAAKAIYLSPAYGRGFHSPETSWEDGDYGHTEFDRNQYRIMARAALSAALASSKQEGTEG